VAILGYAQLVALLPVSLFGVSVAAVALPELSRNVAGNDVEELRSRLALGLRRVAFFVLPSAAALAALPSEILGALFQTGAFGATQTAIAAGVLAAYAIGIPAQATVKLFASGHYAFGDTRTPVRIAVVSVVVSAGSAYLLMQRFGPAGIALGAAIAAYLNASLNLATLVRRVGSITGGVMQRWLAVAAGSVVPATIAGVAASRAVDGRVGLAAVLSLSAFGLVYGGCTVLLDHPDAKGLLARVLRPRSS
jgi:putative peptidoglycan lipid II flippase